jgi:antitoxin (DNA-binding transcriptional repressor) of toxin-antitoxin stability system
MLLMSDISAHDLRDDTMTILRRAEAGERLRVTVGRRPVAQLGPIGKGSWTSGQVMEQVLRQSPSDRGLLDDLAVVRKQIVE